MIRLSNKERNEHDMRKSEYIIWKAETREQIEKNHPDWTKDRVQEFLEKLETMLVIDNV